MSHVNDETRKAIRKTAAISVAVIFVLVLAFFWKITQPRALRISEMQSNGLMYFETPREVLPFELLDEDGQTFTREDLKGKWTMIFPGFTHCPDICPTTMAQLSQMWGYLDENPKEDLQVIMLSVDPNRDTVEILNQYVNYFNEDFIGLTGDLGTIADLAAQLNIAFDIINPDNAADDYDVAHSANIVLVNPAGNYQGFFRPPFDPAILKLNYQSVWVQN